MTWNTWIWIGSECSKWPTCFWANCKPVLHHCVKNSKTVTLLQNPDNQNFKALGRKTKLVHFYLVFYGGIPSIFFPLTVMFWEGRLRNKKVEFSGGKNKKLGRIFFYKNEKCNFLHLFNFFCTKKEERFE